jgi:hypothetical protein
MQVWRVPYWGRHLQMTELTWRLSDVFMRFCAVFLPPSFGHMRQL